MAIAERKTNLAYEQVASHLRRLILSGKVRAGQRLPSEAVLCSRFRVSRSTVREALRALAAEGIVRTTRGVRGGTRVRRFGFPEARASVSNALVMLSNADAVTVTEILMTREMFEVPASRLAANEARASDVSVIRSYIPARSDRLTAEESYRLNVAFHMAIVTATGNHLLETLVRPLFETLETRFQRDLAPKHFWRKVADEHIAILRAIEAKDGNLAARLMAQHLADVRPLYESIDSRSRAAVSAVARPRRKSQTPPRGTSRLDGGQKRTRTAGPPRRRAASRGHRKPQA